MKRREFLKSSLFSLATASGFSLGLPSSRVWGAHGGATLSRTLVDVMLYGGADLRFALVPLPDDNSEYVRQFWEARKGLYTSSYSSYASMYADQYKTVSDSQTGFSFGVHNSCGWLASQFTNNNVAIVSNVFGSLNRRHDHSQLIINTGDVVADLLGAEREGWGGRLTEAVGGSRNVVSISNAVSQFCKGSNTGNRLAQVIHGQNMRDIGLPSANGASVLSRKNIVARALTAYYRERAPEVEAEKPFDWPYHYFFQHYSKLRSIGDSVDARLSGHALPASLAGLRLNKASFALQCRNLYDFCFTADILNSNVLSMDYTDWDTHKGQQDQLQANFSDIFGSGGGLDTVSTQLDQDVPGATDNLLYVFTSDFGRQLAANGGQGTDHGRGSCMILIGNSVEGGVYGDLFPQREAMPDPADSLGRTPFEIPGRDIEGLTSFDRILAEACEWVAPGTGSIVFPGASSSSLEADVEPSDLFSV